MGILLEIGTHAPSEFKLIDEQFKLLKLEKDKTKKQKILIKLENVLENIFKTSFNIEIQYVGRYNDNCAILPKFKKRGKISYKNNIVQLGNISKLYIILGVELLNDSTPRQMTAIILHEIGHIINHTTYIIDLIYDLTHKTSSILDVINKIPIINTIFFPIFFITTRTMHWTEHIGEYNADKLPIQYGYGDELASVIHKWNLKYQRTKNKQTIFQKLGILKDIIFGTTHPSDTKRIKQIANEVKKNYSDKYKSKRLDKLLEYYSIS